LKLEIAANALPNMNFEEERETLAKVERHIAEARKYIARQRVLVQNVVDKGELSIEAKSTLQSLESSLRCSRSIANDF